MIRMVVPLSPRICISGWHGVNNTGDEAILCQFIHEIAACRDALLRMPNGLLRSMRVP